MVKQSLSYYLNILLKEHPEQVFRYREEVQKDYFLTSLVMEMDKRRNSRVVILENIKGSKIPVVGNIFSSRKRIATMLGCNIDNFPKKWMKAENNLLDPVIVKNGPVKDNIIIGEDVDLFRLPISYHFNDDAGPYITSGILVARDPDSGVYNLSFHRLQLKGKDKFGVSLHSRGHLWDYFRRAEEKRTNLPVAVIVGCHPLIYLAAASKMSMDIDEYSLAGSLMEEPLCLTHGSSCGLLVPAASEIVLEGKILANVREAEGPLGEYTGYSTSRSTENVFVVDAIMNRNDPYFLDIVPGNSSEHLLLGGIAKEIHIIERLREAVPALINVNFPRSGTHFHAYLSMKKTDRGQVKQALILLFGLDHYIKLAIAVDEDINIFNEEEVLWAVATRVQADRDVFIIPDVICNKLDPSSPEGISAKMGIDATMPLNQGIVRCRTNKKTDFMIKDILEN